MRLTPRRRRRLTELERIMAHLKHPNPPWVEIDAWVKRVTRLTLDERRLGAALTEREAPQ